MTKLVKLETKTKPRSIVLYGRVSKAKAPTDTVRGPQTAAAAREHTEANGLSLDAQIDAGRRYAAMAGLGVIGEFREVQSGKKASNRPKLQEALALCKKHRAVFHIWSLSRAARSVRDSIEIIDTLTRAGCDILSSTENVDTSTPMGRMAVTLIQSVAQLELELCSERITNSLNLKRTRGERLGGKLPYGYKVAANGKELIEVKAEIKTIEFMIVERNRGKSYAKIAALLNSKNIPTKTGKEWRGRTVNSILTRQTKEATALAA